MEDIIIRKYKKEDRSSVRDIAWETAFKGEPASVFFSDREILTDFLTLYFTDYEPESCFVAEYKGNVIGYLIGSQDESTLKKISTFRIMPLLAIKILTRGVLLKRKDMEYLWSCFISFLKGEFRDPDFSIEYPAVLHINVMNGFRGSGIGSRLISAFLECLKIKKIKGVHLCTVSDRAENFFKTNGFDLLYSTTRSYFRYIIHEDIAVYIYGKKVAF